MISPLSHPGCFSQQTGCLTTPKTLFLAEGYIHDRFQVAWQTFWTYKIKVKKISLEQKASYGCNYRENLLSLNHPVVAKIVSVPKVRSHLDLQEDWCCSRQYSGVRFRRSRKDLLNQMLRVPLLAPALLALTRSKGSQQKCSSIDLLLWGPHRSSA